MKRINQIICLLLLTLVGVNLFGSKPTSLASSTKYYDDTKTSSWESLEEQTENLYGMTHTLSKGEVSTSGATSPELVNSFSMKTDGVSSKLVTWAKQTSLDGYATMKLTDLASDYEKMHPGWIVVGGINADQWYYSTNISDQKGGYYWFNNQPYYSMVMDNENRFVINPYGGTGNVVGFLNSGEKNALIEDSSRQNDLLLTIMDPNTDEVIKTYKVKGINQTPEDGEISVWSPYVSEVDQNTVPMTVSTNSNLFVVEKAQLAYMNNSRFYTSTMYNNVDSFFGKGLISSIQEKTTVTLNRFQFALETNNEEVKSYLSKNAKVLVEHQFSLDAMNEVESASGYHTVHVKDGVDQKTTAPYNTKQYSRSVFGQKEDGTYFLMTVSNKKYGTVNYNGTNFTETNAILSSLGAYDAYQDDGGGSVTAIVRNSYGSFDIVNESSDSSTQRNIFSGLFFVVRDSKITCYQKDATRFTMKLSRTLQDDISNVCVHVDNKDVAFSNDVLELTNLNENTDYNVEITYDVTTNGQTKQGSMWVKFKTKSFQYPQNPIYLSSQMKTSLTFDIKEDFSSLEDIKNIVIKVGEENYPVDQFPYTIDSLIEDTEYQITYEYDIKDSETQNYYSYHETSPTKTLAFFLPTIDRFEIRDGSNTEVQLKYSFDDVDGVLTKAYIKCDSTTSSNVILLDTQTQSGSKTIPNLQLDEMDYTLTLVLTYLDNGQTKQVKSTPIQLYMPLSVNTFEVTKLVETGATLSFSVNGNKNQIVKGTLKEGTFEKELTVDEIKKGKIELTNLERSKNHEYVVSFECVNSYGESYTVTSQKALVSKIFIVPTITEFTLQSQTKNSYVFHTIVNDVDSVISKTYLTDDKTKVEVSIDSQTGNVILTDNPFEQENVKLVVEYSENGQIKKVTSNSIALYKAVEITSFSVKEITKEHLILTYTITNTNYSVASILLIHNEDTTALEDLSGEKEYTNIVFNNNTQENFTLKVEYMNQLNEMESTIVSLMIQNEVPTISSFECFSRNKTSATLSFSFAHLANCNLIQIECNNQTYTITKEDSTFTINDLSLSKSNYSCTLELSYTDIYGESQMVTKEITIEKKKGCQKDLGNFYLLASCLLLCVVVIQKKKEN